MHPESVAAVLGINKPPEWMLDMITECLAKMEENPEVFTDLLLAVAAEKQALPFVHAAIVLDKGEALTTITKTFYILGFMKGVVRTEEIQQLNKLMEGG